MIIFVDVDDNLKERGNLALIAILASGGLCDWAKTNKHAGNNGAR